jgi:glycine cleavage system H lipoate-binding protein
VIAIFVIAIVLCALTADYAVQLLARRKLASTSVVLAPSAGYATDGHVTVYPEPDGLVKVGIDGVAAWLLGQPDRIEWTQAKQVSAGAPLVTLHRRGRKLVLRAPLDGTVVEQNRDGMQSAAQESLDLSPAHWLARVRPTELHRHLEHMRTGESLRQWLRMEMNRLRAIVIAQAPQLESVGATALDGGPISPAIADQLDDTAFYETARALMGEAAVDLSGAINTASQEQQP